MSDGKDLLRRLRGLLNEDSDSGWLDTQTSYDFLYDAAVEYVDRTGCLRSSQSITTVADQTDYNINPDFLRLYLKNTSNNFYIKYNDGSNDNFLTWKDYEDIFYESNTTSVSVPSKFTIIDADLPTLVYGNTTLVGAASYGRCYLTDTGNDFSDVNAGATVRNEDDSSAGVVISKLSSSTVLMTALFGGTNDDWTLNDYYAIQPQARYKLIIDPPPSTGGHTITLPYVQRPDPVYWDYGAYAFVNPSALVKYAFWLYKYRDKDPNFGDAMYRFWEAEVAKKAYSINRGQRPTRIKVNLKARQ